MKKRRRTSGFTMAELLIVVAIIGILSGVGVVAVQNHRRSMTTMDHNAIAKEIYIAAQNHLTMAETQGYMGTTNYGNPAGASNVYYFLYNQDNYSAGNSVLDQMLPFGSIDETVRTGGRYLVRYRKKPARVLDVFYWEPDGKPYGGSLSYDSLKGYFGTGVAWVNGVAVGWYGSAGGEGNGGVAGDEAIEIGTELQPPVVEVENAERLIVRVSYPSDGNRTDGMQMKLIITGLDASGEETGMLSIPVPISNSGGSESDPAARVSNDTVVLDDITAPNLHFADLLEDSGYEKTGDILPGANITISAVAYDNTAFTNIAYSNEWTANSLFADVVEDDTDTATKVAHIANIRHLENLDNAVSGVDNAGNQLFDKAIQTVDLAWSGTAENAFTSKITGAKIYKLNDATGTAEGNFLPVSPSNYSLVYASSAQAGSYRSITGVVVNGGEAGLFGAPTMPLTVSNLELIDFRVTATGNGNAGALAANLPAGSSITNVLAHNSDAGTAATVASADGSAGGLVGKMKDATIRQCAAALVVNSTGGSAGGLVGESSGGSIADSYSGGHAITYRDSSNKITSIGYDSASYNVTAAASAGGLVGKTGVTALTNCYSTCSASGGTAGGLVGEAIGNISGSYATGRVSGTTNAGAFAGTLNSSYTVSDCYYYEIINEDADTTAGATYMQPISGVANVAGVTAFDADAGTFNAFCDAPSAWADAEVYDTDLKTYYNKGDADAAAYSLRAIQATAAEDGAPTPYVATHYGDWPVPEIFLIND